MDRVGKPEEVTAAIEFFSPKMQDLLQDKHCILMVVLVWGE